MMSNSILMDLFDSGDFNEIMIMFHHSLIHDNPLLANSVADFVLWHAENSEGIGEEEQVILTHLTAQLIKADEVRFQKKKPPLAQEYDQLISKRIH